MGQGAAHKPTDESKLQVERLKAILGDHKQIAHVMGISDTTLEKYYKKELAEGKSKVDAFVGGQLLKKIKEGDRACIMFYLKCRCGWREVSEVQHNGEVQLPIPQLVPFEPITNDGNSKDSK